MSGRNVSIDNILKQTITSSDDSTKENSEPKQFQYEKQSITEVLATIKEDFDSLCILAYGVDWCFPTTMSLDHLVAQAKALNMRSLRVFCVDEEANVEYCHEHGIVVGVSAFEAYYRGKQLHFSRTQDPQERAILMAPLNPTQAKQLLQAAIAAVKNNTPILVDV